MASVFDPNTFGSMTFDGTQGSTESVPIPAEEYEFTVDSYKILPWSKKDDPSINGLKGEFYLKTEDERAAEATGRKANKVRYEIMFDLTEDGGLDFGKGMNVALNRMREALGLNKAGQPWSFDMFVGRSLRAKIKHREWDGKLLAEVKEVVYK